MSACVARRHRADGAELRHAVPEEDLAVETLAEPPQRRRRDRRAADVDRRQAGEVGLVELRRGDDELHHRRHQEGGHRAVGGDVGEPACRVEARQEPSARPPRIGPQTSREPLVVANGEQVRKPRPSHRFGTRSIEERSPWRTATPLGSPVVPEV